MKKIGFVEVAFIAVCAVVAVISQPGQARAAELVFYMSEACGVCDRWKEEVGGIYPKTDEAKTLPLRTVSVHDDPPADLAFVKGVMYTPTFVVVEDGREVGRIVGYISDYFFWEKVSEFAGQVDAVKAAETASACSGPVNGETLPQGTC